MSGSRSQPLFPPLQMPAGAGRAPSMLGGDDPAPPPVGGRFVRDATRAEIWSRASRVNLAGGALNTVLTQPDTTVPFEQLFRRLPQQGIHDPDISFQRPFVLELGSFVVPQQQALLLFDFKPLPYRFSGIDPNDAVPFEARRFAGQMGYDLAIDGKHPGNTRFELQPIRAQEGLGFSTQMGTDGYYNPGKLPPLAAYVQQQANQFGAASGGGLATLPQRPFGYGPTSLPLTLFVSEGEKISFRAIIFKPIQSPIAFFEMDMAGVIVPINTARLLLECISPTPVGGG